MEKRIQSSVAKDMTGYILLSSCRMSVFNLDLKMLETREKIKTVFELWK